jgi:hypothetical protein
LSKHRGAQPAEYKRSWIFDTARKVEFHLLKAFGVSFEPLARVSRQQQLDLEFELPGGNDYRLRFSLSGLHWKVAKLSKRVELSGESVMLKGRTS